MSTVDRRPTGTVYEQVQASAEFSDLRSRLRRFVFPVSAAFLLWYLAYVLLASYAPAFMGTKLFVGPQPGPGDDVNITYGLLIGLLQFVSTFAITTAYLRYASKHIDPAAERIRGRIEGEG